MNSDQLFQELYNSPEIQALLAHEFDEWVESMESSHQGDYLDV